MVVARKVRSIGRAARRHPANRRFGGLARLAVPFVAAALVLGACSEEEPADGSDTTAEDPGGDSETSMSVDEATEWFIDYTGGTAGAAEGEPYRIGFAHSTESFPEGDQAADAAIELINSELGGVGGRPLELVKCDIAVPEDGAKCGAQFANDDEIDLVVSGLVLAGNSDLYAALPGEAAALMATPLDASDYTNPNAVSYNTGALGAGMGGAMFVNQDLEPETAALVVTDDVAGRGGAAVLAPINEEAGVDVQQVFVPPTATSAEIAAALQAAGAATADVVTLGLFEQGCISAYDALKSLGLEPTVVTTSVCTGNAMQEHLQQAGEGDAPDGWYFVGGSLLVEELPEGAEAYVTMAEEVGLGEVAESVAAPIVFSAIMNAAKHVNSVGVDDASFETLDEAVRGFTGPDMLQTGPIECGIPPYVAVCANEISVSRYVDGEWEAVRSAPGGNPVDITPYLRPGG